MAVSLLSRATVRDSSSARTSLLKSRPSTCPPFTRSPGRTRHSWIRPVWLEPTRVEREYSMVHFCSGMTSGGAGAPSPAIARTPMRADAIRPIIHGVRRMCRSSRVILGDPQSDSSYGPEPGCPFARVTIPGG